MMVFQIQLTHRNDTLPLTRGYMEKAEKALAMHEIAHQPAAAEGVRPKRRRKVGARK
jgi:cyclopropane-fatty-acyl-phospholipid synthase